MVPSVFEPLQFNWILITIINKIAQNQVNFPVLANKRFLPIQTSVRSSLYTSGLEVIKLFFMLNSVEQGWSGGAMVLDKLPVPGRPTNLDHSRARAYCACSRCGWGMFGHFFSRLSFLSSFSLSLGDGPI